MAEQNYEEQAAKQWILETENEISAVKDLLSKVAQECTMNPADTDPIMKAIEDAGHKMEDAWNQLIDVFTEVKEKSRSIFNNIDKFIDEAVDKVTSYANQIHN